MTMTMMSVVSIWRPWNKRRWRRPPHALSWRRCLKILPRSCHGRRSRPPWSWLRGERQMLHPVPRPPRDRRLCLADANSGEGAAAGAAGCDVTWPPGPRMHSSPTCAGPRWYSGPTVRQSTEHARGSGITLCPPLRGRRQGAVSHIASPCGRSCGRPTLCRADSDTLFRVQ